MYDSQQGQTCEEILSDCSDDLCANYKNRVLSDPELSIKLQHYCIESHLAFQEACHRILPLILHRDTPALRPAKVSSIPPAMSAHNDFVRLIYSDSHTLHFRNSHGSRKNNPGLFQLLRSEFQQVIFNRFPFE